MAQRAQDGGLQEEALQQATQQMAAYERLGEEILQDKSQITDFDRRRNSNREALREMRRGVLKDERKVWMNLGDFFVKIPVAEATELVEKDQETLTAGIEEVRDAMKHKVAQLRTLEGDKLSAGWFQKAVSSREFDSDILGGSM